MTEAHPFDCLSPKLVQDALTQVGLWGDGRLSALSSYENRVYLAHLERPEQGHDAVVLKFYRPGRWREDQILEEHAFAHELAEAEEAAPGDHRRDRSTPSASSPAKARSRARSPGMSAPAAAFTSVIVPSIW